MSVSSLMKNHRFTLGEQGAILYYKEERPMSQDVNENQQVDLNRIRTWAKEGQELQPQILELLDLVDGAGFLQDVQKARENMIVEDMASEAGLINPQGDSNGPDTD